MPDNRPTETKHMGCRGRLYPTPEQAQQINQTIGNCRFIYNHMLDRQQKIYSRRGEHLTKTIHRKPTP